jgi:hypothetical protein
MLGVGEGGGGWVGGEVIAFSCSTSRMYNCVRHIHLAAAIHLECRAISSHLSTQKNKI